MSVIEFTVVGVPIPQGSKSAYVQNGRAVMADANKKLKPWRKAITEAAALARLAEPLDGPLKVVIEFRFVRPKTVKRATPAVKPDLDKLVRAVFDGITDSRVWVDDGQVVNVNAWKTYASTNGAQVRVTQIEGQDK